MNEWSALLRLLRDEVDPELRIAAGDRFEGFVARLAGIEGLPEPAATEVRWQDGLIRDLIDPGSRVLDLGCGNGELLARLIAERNVRGQGVEFDLEQVEASIARAVPVMHIDLDGGLKGFSDASFDWVVLEETLQTLMKPQAVLQDMLRVGRRAIVSFPNFGHWRVRLDLMLRGRMPATRRLPHQWYDTPNIHHLTLADFQDWCLREGLHIDRGWVLDDERIRPLADGDNLRASEVLLVVRRG